MRLILVAIACVARGGLAAHLDAANPQHWNRDLHAGEHETWECNGCVCRTTLLGTCEARCGNETATGDDGGPAWTPISCGCCGGGGGTTHRRPSSEDARRRKCVLVLVGIFASSVAIFLAGHAWHMLRKKEPPVALAVTAEELETGADDATWASAPEACHIFTLATSVAKLFPDSVALTVQHRPQEDDRAAAREPEAAADEEAPEAVEAPEAAAVAAAP